jgi:hypothetical protein
MDSRVDINDKQSYVRVRFVGTKGVIVIVTTQKSCELFQRAPPLLNEFAI